MSTKDHNIFVTQPSLPELKEFIPYLEDIWRSRQLTNNAKYHQLLEKEMAEFLGVKYISLFTNGTLALLTALQSLEIKGEVITTPYSFVATSNTLWWNKTEPVFVDIEPDFCNIDADKIEAAITPKTTAILPVHVYGNPCNIKKIRTIAEKHGLKVIYDAAHAFGVNLNGHSICDYGDLTILSFHATKVFNTMEGGAIVSHDFAIKQRIDHLKNFGFAGETKVIAPGINSKMNEMQAALGILQLACFDENIEKRKTVSEIYREKLIETNGIHMLAQPDNCVSNYSYLPIFVDGKKYGLDRDALYVKLQKNGIYGRRYFYPLISDFPMYNGLVSASASNLPVAKRIADSVICLPIYPDLLLENVFKICQIINDK